MRQNGLRQVSNPSELLLTQNREGLSGVAIAAAIEGVRSFLIETQALAGSAVYGTPQRSATGFDLRRMNMLLAVLEKRAEGQGHRPPNSITSFSSLCRAALLNEERERGREGGRVRESCKM